MVGLSNAQEVAVLDDLYGQTLYLRLLHYSGSPGGGVGLTVNDDGTMPSNVAEVSTGGYTPRQVLASAWTNASSGAPTTKSVPKPGGSDITFTPTGGAEWDICGYCWTTDNTSIDSDNLVSAGVIVDTSGDTAVQHVTAVAPLEITENNPISERLGDPPAGVDPT